MPPIRVAFLRLFFALAVGGGHGFGVVRVGVGFCGVVGFRGAIRCGDVAFRLGGCGVHRLHGAVVAERGFREVERKNLLGGHARIGKVFGAVLADADAVPPALAREDEVLRIFGGQRLGDLRENDAERISGMLEEAGALPVLTIEEADIAVFLTCCVREKAELRLMGQVASIKNVPSAHEAKRIIAVGGCIGQLEGASLRDELSHVDIVFGTHNLGHLVDLIQRRLVTGEPQVETIDVNDGFSSDLPVRREKPWHAWVPIMTGCDNFCSYCIVPYVRGREMSRPLDDVAAELALLADEGIREVTLLGQNVNSYGRDLYGTPRFAEVLSLAG